MVRKVALNIAIILLMLFGKVAFSRDVFEVTGTDSAGPVQMILCLQVEGKPALTCEKHTVSGLDLLIRTTISNKRYKSAGIKLLTAGYSLAGANCTPMINGYCSFSVSDSLPHALTMTKTETYTVGGTVTGLTAEGLVLQNNGGDDLSVAPGASTFQFNERLIYAASYDVTILAQPTEQRCTVSQGAGTKITGNVENVLVHCVDLKLYASTGAGSDTNPNSLYTMQITGTDAGLGTFVMHMTDSDGAVIASDGRDIYHWTGYAPLETFERVNLSTSTLTPIAFSGDYISEVFGAVFYGGSFRVSDYDDSFYTFTTGGVVTQIGTDIDDRRGFAYYDHRMYAVSPRNDKLYEINPDDGQTLKATPITLSGFTVDKALAITADPNTGLAYALLKVDGDSNRKLVTIDLTTGTATLLGDARGEAGDERFSSLAFHPADNADY